MHMLYNLQRFTYFDDKIVVAPAEAGAATIDMVPAPKTSSRSDLRRGDMLL